MRVKHIWELVPIPAKLKLLADRITFSKITLFYVVFSIIHCLIQVILQARAFQINAGAANFLKNIITEGNGTVAGFSVLGPTLRVCDTVPKAVDASTCQLVWSGTTANSSVASHGSQEVVSLPPSQQASSLASSISVAPFVAGVDQTASPSVNPPSAQLSIASPVQTSTITVTARPTLPIAFLKPEDDAEPTVTITRTKTVGVSPTQFASSSDEDEHGEEKRDNSRVISTVTAVGQIRANTQDTDEAQLSQTCFHALNWPLGKVKNTKREDIAFIGFSIWVLGMSVVAILNESPPHIVASFLTHMLATAWSGIQLVNTNQFHDDFNRLITRGACGVNLLPSYWSDRAKAEIPTLALNVLALLISAYLSWKLMKSFGWQTFKRIGASLTISQAYRSVLVLSITIQLSVFFIVVTVALWIDQIYNGEIARFTSRSVAFRAVTIMVLILVIPWLTLGWISVRREYRWRMVLFLVLSFGYLVGWAAMFAAPTFRWTFVEWRFFSLITSASVFLALATLVLGIICRLNFGKGLPRYLNAQEPLPGDDFIPATVPLDEKMDEEKVDFPTQETPIPTFSAAYGLASPQLPPPSYAAGLRTLGPRFYAPDASREVKILSRQGSGSSQRSDNSISSSDSSLSSLSMKGRRWVIE